MEDIMRLYKLTDQNGQTRNNTQWGENITHSATGNENQDLCSDGWIHAYESPLVAVLLNPVHASISNPILWEAEGEMGKRNGQSKCGCRTLTTVKQIPLPEFTATQKSAFAILVVKEVFKDENFQKWADSWLSGQDRSEAAAWAAEAAARAAWAARAAARAAWAARAAAWAARAAARAAEAAARAAWAARAAAWAAWAARAAARAAEAAARAADLDLHTLAEKALRY